MRARPFAPILAAVEQTGLVPRGAMRLEKSEQRGELAEFNAIVLAGVAGRDGWSAFAASAEAGDGIDHPLDRWSRRVIEALAGDLGAVAFFPFGGPPYWPFQQWAQRSEPVHPSPIGLLIHPRYGLWHSYRGALGFREPIDVPELAATRSPCDSCLERWCLNTCPVGAFSPGDYDVAVCVGHLKNAAGADCMGVGCRARRACPVGAEHAYGAEQANFTMRAFLKACNSQSLSR